MLSGAAFNALLKTLEEPPPHVKFIFATTEPHKLPDTILSRCQRYDFRRIPAARMLERLKQIAAAEKASLSDTALSLIVRQAEGGMRDALSLLDQVLSACGPGASDERGGRGAGGHRPDGGAGVRRGAHPPRRHGAAAPGGGQLRARASISSGWPRSWRCSCATCSSPGPPGRRRRSWPMRSSRR